MELSFPEILLILAIALVVLGPQDLLKTSQQLGRWVGKIRTQFNNMKIMLNEEMLQEERRKLEELKGSLGETLSLKTNENIEVQSAEVSHDLPSAELPVIEAKFTYKADEIHG